MCCLSFFFVSVLGVSRALRNIAAGRRLVRGLLRPVHRHGRGRSGRRGLLGLKGQGVRVSRSLSRTAGLFCAQ